VQQSKLAALGRLSASIAHEIRNPVGAMSHAATAAGEEREAGAREDRRLTQIICNNAERVSGIIDNVQRSGAPRGDPPGAPAARRPGPRNFREEFCETMQWPPGRVCIDQRHGA
jgi:hypothetical protein